MECLICGKQYNHLGSHIWHKHKIKARDYKKEFGLDLNFPLISEEIKIKKQEAFKKNRKKYLKNLFSAGKKYQFKKGCRNIKNYISGQSHERYIENLKKINSKKSENCPICNLKTNHLFSHLFNSHSIVVFDKNKFYKNI